MQFLKEEGGLKMGDCHLEVWLYESSTGPGKVLRERRCCFKFLSVRIPKTRHSGMIRMLW